MRRMSHRTRLRILWSALALATLIILIIDGNPIRWAVTALAWTGGIVSDRLYIDRKTRGDQ